MIQALKKIGPEVLDTVLDMQKEEALRYINPLSLFAHVLFLNTVARYNMT
jgi:hypothetical protein